MIGDSIGNSYNVRYVQWTLSIAPQNECHKWLFEFLQCFKHLYISSPLINVGSMLTMLKALNGGWCERYNAGLPGPRLHGNLKFYLNWNFKKFFFSQQCNVKNDRKLLDWWQVWWTWQWFNLILGRVAIFAHKCSLPMTFALYSTLKLSFWRSKHNYMGYISYRGELSTKSLTQWSEKCYVFHVIAHVQSESGEKTPKFQVWLKAFWL